MNYLDLLEKVSTSNQETKLKLYLINKYEELGLDKTYLILAFRNQLLLNSCNIDENKFNYILLKNYIYFLNSKNNINFNNIQDKNKEMLIEFNNNIYNNDFAEALNLYEENVYLYEVLCSVYLKNLSKSEAEKINNIPQEKIDDVYKKISLLQETNLTFKRNNKIKIMK